MSIPMDKCKPCEVEHADLCAEMGAGRRQKIYVEQHKKNVT